MAYNNIYSATCTCDFVSCKHHINSREKLINEFSRYHTLRPIILSVFSISFYTVPLKHPNTPSLTAYINPRTLESEPLQASSIHRRREWPALDILASTDTRPPGHVTLILLMADITSSYPRDGELNEFVNRE